MINIKRLNKKFQPDHSRVIIKPNLPIGNSRIERIILRVLSLPEEKVEQILERVLIKFSDRHKNLWETFKNNYNQVQKFIPKNNNLSNNRKALLGAYFSCEYSIQAAAFFNPSMFPHFDQSGLDEGSLRFILSFRSVGEGHISSIEFRGGVIDKNCNLNFDKVSRYSQRAQNIIHINDTDYKLEFDPEDELSERVIFPATKNDCNGIEDARFVRFIDDNKSVTYYATYTAYDGHNILPKMIETKDFINFKIFSLTGEFSKNKGMALFPRKINGKYMMVSRMDGENLYIMTSDDITKWDNATHLKCPETEWEFVQIGNCGSPIETYHGWLLLTHGVGPMREYSIGVTLLDIENPDKVIGNISEPLLVCNQEEREGYVPNVVYSCGSIIHNNTLIMPYAMSDTSSGIVTVKLSDLFTKMENENQKEMNLTKIGKGQKAYANTT